MKPRGCMAEMEPWAGSAPTGPARVLPGPRARARCAKGGLWEMGDGTAQADLERDREPPFLPWRIISPSTRSVWGPRTPA